MAVVFLATVAPSVDARARWPRLAVARRRVAVVVAAAAAVGRSRSLLFSPVHTVRRPGTLPARLSAIITISVLIEESSTVIDQVVLINKQHP